MKLSEFVKAEYGKSISECTNEELYYALLASVYKGIHIKTTKNGLPTY